eukprot:EG_transcript_26251
MALPTPGGSVPVMGQICQNEAFLGSGVFSRPGGDVTPTQACMGISEEEGGTPPPTSSFRSPNFCKISAVFGGSKINFSEISQKWWGIKRNVQRPKKLKPLWCHI